jgi:hypothetical protein
MNLLRYLVYAVYFIFYYRLSAKQLKQILSLMSDSITLLSLAYHVGFRDVMQ